jgi:integrase
MVRVETVDNRLRLRWNYGGKRYCLAIGTNTPDAQKAAKLKASKIERDILFEEFDPSLSRYKQEQFKTAVDIWDSYTKHKQTKVTQATQVHNYRCVRVRLLQWKGPLQSTTDAEKFLKAHSDIESITLRGYLCSLNAAWELAVSQKLVKVNPWKGVKVKVPPQQRVKPFSEEEVRAIVGGFRSSPYYSHYTDFIVFLFSTGLRFGEAAGLRWGAVAEDYSSIWIGEIVTRGVRRPTKTNRDRTIPLSKGLQALLQTRRPPRYNPDDLVFPSPEGNAIDSHNFRNRAWIKVLTELGIPYRKPYTTRATFISLALARGANPVELSAITGHNVQTMFKHYAGVVGQITVPELVFEGIAIKVPEGCKQLHTLRKETT